MKRINPIYLLIILNIVLVVFRDLLLPEAASAAIAETVEATMLRLGPFGYLSLVLIYGLCGFFFVPLLIPLNILGGALYGAYIGTAVALAGVTLGCVASTVSVRYVFTGMQSVVDRRPGLQKLISRAENHQNLAIVMVRLAVFVPYLWQNIALAITKSSATRIALITVIAGLPGAAIYSFLGAGLVQADDVTELLIYLAVPGVMLLVITGAMAWFGRKYHGGESKAKDDTRD